jgi:hypothetical protein
VIHDERDDRIGAGRLADPHWQGGLAGGAGRIGFQASRILAALSFSQLT